MIRAIQTALFSLVICVLMVPLAHGIPAMPDDCGGVTWEGECEGHELWWCEEGQLLVADCSELGGTCGWVEGQGVFDCVEVDSGCGGETFEGRCDGTSVVWCEEEVVYEADCATLESLPGAQCGYNCELGAYDCAAPGDQVPNASMCEEAGGGGLSVEPGDEDASGGSSEAESEATVTSGGCAAAVSGNDASWVLLAFAGLLLFGRRRRQMV